jgi:multiple sugar transport system ATP-binding protein
MAAIALDQVDKIYPNGVQAVRDVSLDIRDGEFMILLGPSGCGKSTTLRMIAGLESVTRGTISIGGHVVNDVDPADRDIAIVFQNYALYPHMTVAQNLAFGLKLRRVGRGEIERRIARIAETLGIGELLGRKPRELSGGQRQRVALGRALVREPKAFLLDEPLSNLDAKLRASMRTELIKLHRQLGTTIVHVTHDQVEAMTMGDRICIMNKGEVVQIGKPLEVYRNPADAFVARFLGNPPMNLLPARLESSGDRAVARFADVAVELPGYAMPALRPYLGGAVTLGIRPEDLYETPPPAVAPRTQQIATRVLAVEPLGAETLLMLATGGSDQEIIARVGRDTGLRMGGAASIALDPNALHLFDPTTTKAIARTA